MALYELDNHGIEAGFTGFFGDKAKGSFNALALGAIQLKLYKQMEQTQEGVDYGRS